MERVLTMGNGFLSLRSFRLPLDLQLPLGSKLALVKPQNPYKLFKTGEVTDNEVVGYAKVLESRAMGHFRDALLDVYFNDKKTAESITGLLREEGKTKLVTDHFRICETTSHEFVALIQ